MPPAPRRCKLRPRLLARVAGRDLRCYELWGVPGPYYRLEVRHRESGTLHTAFAAHHPAGAGGFELDWEPGTKAAVGARGLRLFRETGAAFLRRARQRIR